MNTYEIKAQKDKTSQWLSSFEDTASDRNLSMGTRVKKGAGAAALKILAGIGGGFAGAAIGRWSILGGIVATGTGEVIGSAELTSFGVGMMASNLIPADSGVNGIDDKSTVQKAKDRMKTYGKGIMQKFWLDKLVKKKATTTTTEPTPASTTTESTNGVGEVKYYTHPQSEPDDLDLQELEKYEQAIKQSGESFTNKSGDSISGTGDDDAFLGTEEERIF
jgi:hypothetical protein